jgi:aerobic carbon-monoxide dehydrogenase medium subunit
MISYSFEIETPRSLDEAVDCMSRHGEAARALAGGTVLIPEMAHARIAPKAVVDLSRAGLGGVRADGNDVVLGATTTYRQLATASATADPPPAIAWLGTVARGITGGAQIRNRGTIGGSATFANPSSDIPAVLVALDAAMVTVSPHRERELPARSFFLDAFRTCLQEDELLTSIRIPALPAGTRFGYEKLKFGESSWPIVTAAVVANSDGALRIGLGGVCPVPIAVDLDDSADVAEAVLAAVADPWSDVLADGTYRRTVAPVIAGRALAKAT